MAAAHQVPAASHGFERPHAGVVDDAVVRTNAVVGCLRPHLILVQSNCSPALLDMVPPACMDSSRAIRSGSWPKMRNLGCGLCIVIVW